MKSKSSVKETCTNESIDCNSYNRSFNKFVIISSILFICLFFFSFVSAVGTYPAVDANMKAYYHFDNNASNGENITYVTDYSGNGVNATVLGPAYNASGFIQSSFDFNGTNNIVMNITPNIFPFINGSNNFSISILYRPNSLAASVDLFSQVLSNGVRFMVGIQSSQIRVTLTNSTGGSSDSKSGGTLVVGDWYHIFYTYNNITGSNLYLNNMELTGTNANGLSSSNVVTYIGGRQNGQGTATGQIDEIIIWNTNKSSNDVNNLYNNYFDCGNIPYNGCLVNQSTIFTKGTYFFTKSILVVNNNTIIDGNGSTIDFDNNNASLAAFNITNVDNITLKNFTFVKNSNQSDGTAISIKYTSNVNIYNSTFIMNNVSSTRTTNIRAYTIWIISSSNISIYNNFFNISNCFYGCALVHSDGSIRVNTSLNSMFAYLGNKTQAIKYRGGTNFSTMADNNISVFNSNDGGWATELESGSVNNSLINNNVIMTGNRTCALYLENDCNYNFILNNTFYVEGENPTGICLESASNYNNFTNNNIIVNNSVNKSGDTKYYSPAGIHLISSNTGNYFYRNNIFLLNSTQAVGIKLYGGSNSPVANNTFINNYIYSNRLDNSYLFFRKGDTASVRNLGSQFINNTYDSIYKKSIEINVQNKFADNSPLIFNTVFLDNDEINFNAYNVTGMLIDLFDGNTGLFNNTNNTYSAQINFLSLNKALIVYSNLSGFIYTGNINISINPKNFTYILNNYNLTEGISRQFSPLSFSQSTLSEKTITSSLTDSVQADTIFDVTTCDSIGNIYYTPAGSSRQLYQRGSYTCSNNQVTISSLTINAGDNVLSIEYSCSQFTNIGFSLIMLMFALAIVSVVAYVGYQQYQKGDLTATTLLALFIFIILGVIVWQISGQNLGAACPVT